MSAIYGIEWTAFTIKEAIRKVRCYSIQTPSAISCKKMTVEFIVKCEKCRKKVNLDEKFAKDYRGFKKATSLYSYCQLFLMLPFRLK